MNPRISGELSSESFARAVAWWHEHQDHVARLMAEDGDASYPPWDKNHPELWRAPNWRWFAGKSAEKQAVYAAQRAAKREQWFKDNPQWTKEALSKIPDRG